MNVRRQHGAYGGMATRSPWCLDGASADQGKGLFKEEKKKRTMGSPTFQHFAEYEGRFSNLLPRECPEFCVQGG